METGVGIVFLIFGLCATAGGLLLARSVYRKLRTWQTLPATIIGYKDYDTGNRSSYIPQVQFTGPDGKLVIFYSSTGSSRKPYRIGANVKVLCPPNDPDKATLKSFTNLCLLPVVALAFGLAFTLVGYQSIFGKGH
jgi:hypothetical protein